MTDTQTQSVATSPPQPLVLAAGHGGNDPGAEARGTTEAAQAIDIVDRVYNKLGPVPRHANVGPFPEQIVRFKVPDELRNPEEVNWVNSRYPRADSCYAAAIHKNSDGPQASGVEAFYYCPDPAHPTKAPGYAPAKAVIDKLSRESGVPFHGKNPVKPHTDNPDRMAWVKNTKPLAGLFECGFLTGPPEAGNPQYPQKGDHFYNDLWAEALVAGFLSMYGLSDKRQVLYRVKDDRGVQTNAFRGRKQAWREYAVRNKGRGGIFTLVEGTDVTAEFRAQYGT